MAFQSNAFQANAFQGVGAPPGGGPVQVGPFTFAGSASVSLSLTVRRSVNLTAGGVANVVVAFAGAASWGDNFDRGTGIGANWTGSVGSDLSIDNSIRVVGAQGVDASMYWTANIPTDAQYSQAKYVGVAGDFRGPIVRASATDFVVLDAQSGNARWKIEWYNGGAWTQIGSDYTVAPADGDVAKITADGSNFEAFINGVSRIVGSNASAPATGYTGLYTYDNIGYLDDFAGGNLAAAGPVQVGPFVISCVATASIQVSVRKANKPLFAGVASATSPIRVRRAIKPSIAGVATAVSPVTVKRSLSLAAQGTGGLSVVFVSGGPVAVGPLLISGAGTFVVLPTVLRSLAPAIEGIASVSSPITVLRTVEFKSPAGVGGMSVNVSVGAGYVGNVGRPGVNDVSQLIAALRTLQTKTPKPRGVKRYSGPYNAPTESEHPIFPPGTMDAGDPDAYVEAVAAYDATFRAEKTAHENAVKRRDDNLELGRRLQGQVPVPKLNPNIVDKEKLYEQSLEKIELKQAWTRNAKMAWVRSFKGKNKS